MSKPRLFGFKIVYSATIVYSAKGLVYSADAAGILQDYHKRITASNISGILLELRKNIAGISYTYVTTLEIIPNIYCCFQK